jgi:hypothetical protein
VPVPELETYALLLVGLGVVDFVVSHCMLQARSKIRRSRPSRQDSLPTDMAVHQQCSVSSLIVVSARSGALPELRRNQDHRRHLSAGDAARTKTP